MSIYHYLFICEAPLLSTAWIPAPIWGLHTITLKLRRGLGICTCLPARTQITPYPKHRLTTTERDRGLICFLLKLRFVAIRLAGPDRTDFSAVRSQSKRPDHETVSIFGPDRTETFIAQAFINKLG